MKNVKNALNCAGPCEMGAELKNYSTGISTAGGNDADLGLNLNSGLHGSALWKTWIRFRISIDDVKGKNNGNLWYRYSNNFRSFFS